MRAHRKKHHPLNLNLVPVMDTIFVFIFFLLVSAEFMEIRDIQGEAPVISTFEDSKLKKEPLNLVLEISNDSIDIKTGLDGHVYKKVAYDEQLTELHKVLEQIKANNIEEDSVILKPAKNLAYGKLVNIMDSIRLVKDQTGEVVGTNAKGETVKSKALFPQLIFETVM